MLVLENNEVAGVFDYDNLMEFILLNEVKTKITHDKK